MLQQILTLSEYLTVVRLPARFQLMSTTRGTETTQSQCGFSRSLISCNLFLCVKLCTIACARRDAHQFLYPLLLSLLSSSNSAYRLLLYIDRVFCSVMKVYNTCDRVLFKVVDCFFRRSIGSWDLWAGCQPSKISRLFCHPWISYLFMTFAVIPIDLSSKCS